MAAKKIKKGDYVIVITGKDKGRTGEVKSRLSDKVIVSGVNLLKKHVKANPDRGIQGGIVEREQSIHVSNVALFDKSAKKPSRVGFKYLENNKKVRYLKSNQETVLEEGRS